MANLVRHAVPTVQKIAGLADSGFYPGTLLYWHLLLLRCRRRLTVWRRALSAIFSLRRRLHGYFRASLLVRRLLESPYYIYIYIYTCFAQLGYLPNKQPTHIRT